MDSMTPFTLHRAHSGADAVALLAQLPQSRLLAGGTDLIPNLRRGINAPQHLIDLNGIAGFDGIGHDAQGWHLGAGVTLAQLASQRGLGTDLPLLAQAAVSIAAPSHRSVATLGGNLCLDTRCVFYNQSQWWRESNHFCLKHGGDVCHVAPQGKRCFAAWSGDLAPALIALDASIDVLGPQGLRQLALADLYVDDGAKPLTLAAGELLTAVHIPAPAAGMCSGYRKARQRGAIDFPLAGVAICCAIDAGTLSTLRVAITGTNSRPFLLAGADALCAMTLDDELFKALGKLVQKQVNPMRTTGTSAAYRRQVAAVLAQRLLRELVGL